MADRYESALRILKNDEQLSEYNRKTIAKFCYDLQTEGISITRQVKYLRILPSVAKLLQKDFNKATVDDIRRVVNEVNRSDFAEWTKSDYRVTLKRFYRWLKSLPKGQNPPETAWISIGGGNKRVLPEELLTQDEIMRLVKVCENSRDRALVLNIYETGGRIGELLNLRRKHVQFDQYGSTLIFSGKTGDRRVRTIESTPALAQWVNYDHPINDPEAPLWINTGDRNHTEALVYDAVRMLLRRLAHKAGIKKRVNPHSFRHARASYLANHLTERQMEQYLGWTTGSKMPQIYVHLSGREVDDALLQLHGMQREDPKKTPELTPLTCPRCNTKNLAMGKFCSKCALPLQIEATLEIENQRSQADDIMNRLFDDPDFRTYIISKLKRLDLNQTSNKKGGVISSTQNKDETKSKSQLPRSAR